MDTTTDESDKEVTWGRLIAVHQNADTPQGPFLLVADHFVLGRHEDCDITLTSKKISGKHCVIYKEAEDGIIKLFVSDARYHVCLSFPTQQYKRNVYKWQKNR